MKSEFSIAGRRIANDGACFVIAEAGVNHNGDVGMAHRLVEVAASAGADAVKFQTFDAAALAAPSARKATYQAAATGDSTSQLAMLQALQLPIEALAALRDHAHKLGILFLSTPFDAESVDVLDKVGLPAFKVSSGDLNNYPLLERIAAKRKPMIISTGMATLAEIDGAMSCLRDAGASEVCALQCTSSYPAPPDQINLRVMHTMRQAFGIPIGYSDHTLGLPVSIAAAALGASVIEKHVTLDRTLPGPDHRASLIPAELELMMRSIREVEASLGSPIKRPVPAEMNTRDVARRSLFAATDIRAGSVITADHLVALRPGNGISPDRRDLVVGRRARENITARSMICLGDLQ